MENSNLVFRNLMEFSLNFKVSHWQTNEYSVHEVLDKLSESYDSLLDKLIETFQGKYGSVIFTDSTIGLYMSPLYGDKNRIIKYIVDSSKYLLGIKKDFEKDIQDIILDMCQLLNNTLFHLRMQ